MFPRHGPVETFNFGYNLRQRSYGTLLFIAVVGIPLNIFLLYLIHRFSRKELGAYKHLLTIFAAHDILLSIIEALFNLVWLDSSYLFRNIIYFRPLFVLAQ